MVCLRIQSSLNLSHFLEVISPVVTQLALDVQFSATTCKIRLFGQLTCVSVHIRSLHAYSALAWHATSAWSHCQWPKTLWSNQRVVNLHGPPESVCQAGHRREITEIAIEKWWVYNLHDSFRFLSYFHGSILYNVVPKFSWKLWQNSVETCAKTVQKFTKRSGKIHMM